MSKSVLVVGGTGFLGGAIAAAARAAGNDVTVLSRGVKAADSDAFRHIAADRLASLDKLRGLPFDLVFDTCAYTPHSVTRLLDAVGAGLSRYVMISSVSAYGDWSRHPPVEDDPLASASETDLQHAARMERNSTLDAATAGEAYGRLKRACELAAEQALGERAISLRAGLLIGAGDYTDRMTWWVRRFDQGGRMPVPMPGDRRLQAIDVRDAADFALRAAVGGRSGTFNLTSAPFTVADLVDTIRRACAVPATPVWIDAQTFFDAGVAPWTDMPLLLPNGEKFRYFFQVSVAKAMEAGLRARPLPETISDILAWDRMRRDLVLSCGLTADQEAWLLGA